MSQEEIFLHSNLARPNVSPHTQKLKACMAEAPAHGDVGAVLIGKSKTTLMIASQTRGPDAQPAVVALLCASMGEINRRDYKGRTALMLAARCGSEIVLQLLIEAGAELEMVCHRKETAWQKASHGGHSSSAALLETAGARHGRSLSTIDEMLLSELMPTPFPMPSVSGCGAPRFASQFRNRMPVCIPGLVAGWPASSTWSNDRERLTSRLGGASCLVPLLRARCESRTVAAEMRAPEDGATFPVSECLSWALDALGSLPPMMSKLPLTRDIVADLGPVPQSIFGAPTVAAAGETRLWVSSSGSVTPLHFDHCHSVICQVVGRKRVTCFAPRDSVDLYPISLGDGNVRTSRVDLMAWRFGSVESRGGQRFQHPDVAFAMPLETVLLPGDAVYIPPGWWHHVETLEGGSISVLMPFDQNADEQRSMDRPWTRPGWGQQGQTSCRRVPCTTQSNAPTVTEQQPPNGNRHICVDPAQLDGFLERERASQGYRTTAPQEGFLHEAEWVDRACLQILHERCGVIRLPAHFSEVYQRLLQPSLYPAEVTDSGNLGRLQVCELPTDLVALSKTWANVCESICWKVTRKLLAITSAVAVPSQGLEVTTTRGLLRISYSGSAHAQHAHYDASYTTFLGAGNVAGWLQFAEEPSHEGEDQTFIPSERLLSQLGTSGQDFFIFAGMKHGGIHGMCRPLLHRVAMPSPTKNGCTSVREGPDEENRETPLPERTNIIYFLNSYTTELSTDSACQSTAKKDKRITTFEINSFGRSSIVNDSQSLCSPPLSAQHDIPSDSPEGEAEASWATLVEDWDEAQVIDWSGDGL